MNNIIFSEKAKEYQKEIYKTQKQKVSLTDIDFWLQIGCTLDSEPHIDLSNLPKIKFNDIVDWLPLFPYQNKADDYKDQIKDKHNKVIPWKLIAWWLDYFNGDINVPTMWELVKEHKPEKTKHQQEYWDKYQDAIAYGEAKHWKPLKGKRKWRIQNATIVRRNAREKFAKEIIKRMSISLSANTENRDEIINRKKKAFAYWIANENDSEWWYDNRFQMYQIIYDKLAKL